MEQKKRAEELLNAVDLLNSRVRELWSGRNNGTPDDKWGARNRILFLVEGIRMFRKELKLLP